MMMALMMAGNEAVGELFELWQGIKSFGAVRQLPEFLLFLFGGVWGFLAGVVGVGVGVLNPAFSGLWRCHFYRSPCSSNSNIPLFSCFKLIGSLEKPFARGSSFFAPF